MFDFMVLMSTRPVAPHTTGCNSSVSSLRSQDRLQKVLISTFSTFDRSSLPSGSALSKSARHDAARALRLRPWRCEQPQPHSESYEGSNGQMLNTAAGSNGVLRAAGRGKAAAALSSSSCECDEGEKQIGR